MFNFFQHSCYFAIEISSNRDVNRLFEGAVCSLEPPLLLMQPHLIISAMISYCSLADLDVDERIGRQGLVDRV